MATQVQRASPLLLYSGLTILVVMMLTAFAYFFVVTVGLLDGLTTLPASIVFDKGAFYLFGVGLGLSVLVFSITYESVLGKALTTKIAGRCTKIGIGAVVVMLVLPQLTHYSVESALTRRGYQECVAASHQWLHARTIVYVTSQDVCDRLAREKKR